MKKKIEILAIVGVLCLASSFPALATWEQQPDTTWKYLDESTGAYLTGQWIESTTEKGLWYYLDDAGVMAVDKVIDGYYVNELGEWREGSQQQAQPTTPPAQSNPSVPGVVTDPQEAARDLNAGLRSSYFCN